MGKSRFEARSLASSQGTHWILGILLCLLAMGCTSQDPPQPIPVTGHPPGHVIPGDPRHYFILDRSAGFWGQEDPPAGTGAVIRDSADPNELEETWTMARGLVDPKSLHENRVLALGDRGRLHPNVPKIAPKGKGAPAQVSANTRIFAPGDQLEWPDAPQVLTRSAQIDVGTLRGSAWSADFKTDAPAIVYLDIQYDPDLGHVRREGWALSPKYTENPPPGKPGEARTVVFSPLTEREKLGLAKALKEKGEDGFWDWAKNELDGGLGTIVLSTAAASP